MKIMHGGRKIFGTKQLFCLATTVILCLSACAKIDLSSGSPGGGAAASKHPTFSGKRQLLTEPPSGNQAPNGQAPGSQPPVKSAPGNATVDLNGHWKVGFLFGKKNLTSAFDLTQDGATTFHGDGKDDQTDQVFKIEKGTISGTSISFWKNYGDGKSVPVEYKGTFQVVDDPSYKGPYLSGDFQITIKDKTMSGAWEAEQAHEAEASQPSEQAPAQAPNSGTPDHAPQLSGKWNVGYEYNFKTVHSTMYLEQDGGKIVGHGIDENNKEKFVIEKGWYNFPKVTLVRKYGKTKGGAQERSMTFKATVSWVNDADYQGPYLNGKTQGGGAWEAQLQK